MGDTKIEWATKVWNPVTGCRAVSTGCENCYAKRMTRRFPHLHGSDVVYNEAEDDRFLRPWPFEAVNIHLSRLQEPLRWRTAQRIFTVSMGDLFHEDVPFHFIDEVFEVIRSTQRHTFIVLTKRPQWAVKWADSTNARHDDLLRRCPNLWIGPSVENQEAADWRIPEIMKLAPFITGKIIVSVEPMLGPVELQPKWFGKYPDITQFMQIIPRIDWVICGGESGPGARPMHPDWARSLRDQCQAAGVPFFFKQWGEWSAEKPAGYCRISKRRYSHEADTFGADGMRYRAYHPDDNFLPGMTTMWRVGKKAAGCLLDGREWKQFPEVKDR